MAGWQSPCHQHSPKRSREHSTNIYWNLERSLVPARDLSLALGVLADSPYKHMNFLDLLELTRKTVSLVAVASVRRVSEIHTFSTKEEHLRFSSGQSLFFLEPNSSQRIRLHTETNVLPDLSKAQWECSNITSKRQENRGPAFSHHGQLTYPSEKVHHGSLDWII